MIHAARALDLRVMLGCMNESSLGIAGAAQISPLVDVVDLDGHLLNANDTHTGLGFADGCVVPGDGPGLGVTRWSRGREALRDPRRGGVRRGGEDRDRRDALRRVADGRGDRLDARGHRRRRPRARPRERRPGRERRWPRRWRSSRRRCWSASHRRAGSCPTPYRTAISRRWRTAWTSRAACTTSSATTPRSPRRPPSRAASCATCAGRRRPGRPHGSEPRRPAHTVLTVGSDCALGKMTVCLELDARRAGGAWHRCSYPRARRASPSPAGGSPSTRWSPTSSPAPPSGWCWRATNAGATARSCGSRARARSTTPSTRASPSACCTAPPRTRCCSCTSPGGD